MASSRAVLTGYRLFLPRSRMLTFIRIKEKDWIFAMLVRSILPVSSRACRKFNDDEAIFSAAATSPGEGAHKWYN
jgi:hypothetical protein